MELRARIEDDGHAYVIGFLRPPNSTEYHYVRFLIDTGCSITSLLSDDAARLGIDCNALPQATYEVTTANGKIRPWCIPKPDLYLVINYGFLNRREITAKPQLPYICCMSASGDPTIPYDRTNSALGMGILAFFRKWEFKDNALIMRE